MGESRPGFRMSGFDAAILIAASILTAVLLVRLEPGSWPGRDEVLLIPVVVVHFFLFCNVFRVWRPYELIWAGVFVVNVAGWWAWDAMTIWRVLAVQLPVTALVIWLQVRSPHYRGVYARYQRR
jgi:hypothetical protein